MLVLLFGCALALVLRLCMIPFESNDYIYFLQNWYEALAAGGGLPALQKPLPDCNYTLAYLSLLAPLADAGVPALIGVKAVSIAFDFLLAGAVAWLLRIVAGRGRMGQLAGAMLTLFLPTVFRIFAASEVPTNSFVYNTDLKTDGEKETFIKNSLESSKFNLGVKPTKDDHLLTLSTCTNFQERDRWVVQAVEVSE